MAEHGRVYTRLMSVYAVMELEKNVWPIEAILYGGCFYCQLGSSLFACHFCKGLDIFQNLTGDNCTGFFQKWTSLRNVKATKTNRWSLQKCMNKWTNTEDKTLKKSNGFTSFLDHSASLWAMIFSLALLVQTKKN